MIFPSGEISEPGLLVWPTRAGMLVLLPMEEVNVLPQENERLLHEPALANGSGQGEWSR
jgi:hypothetical protein